jgi:hypothetical protein
LLVLHKNPYVGQVLSVIWKWVSWASKVRCSKSQCWINQPVCSVGINLNAWHTAKRNLAIRLSADFYQIPMCWALL